MRFFTDGGATGSQWGRFPAENRPGPGASHVVHRMCVTTGPSSSDSQAPALCSASGELYMGG